ncbi:MAG TPA: hypothetical protein VFV79_01780, partial [Saprospiraceae bacterium]|nr:hypothetical protein [Saprospiraceae bacterium]
GQQENYQDDEPEEGSGIGIEEGHRIDFFVNANLQPGLSEIQIFNGYKGGTGRGTKRGQV